VRLAYPHPAGARSHYDPHGLHDTGGLPGNRALDFLAAGGTKVVAPQAGIVARLGGHNPVEGMLPGAVFGWSVYLDTLDGFYFITHFGVRSCHVGQHVQPGTLLGRVGHWPHDKGRSHTHCGFTAHAGRKASRARIEAVGLAPHVKPISL
jgi:murein DD-endopeptidase MepM/ murein hydrolase activator NlpD